MNGKTCLTCKQVFFKPYKASLKQWREHYKCCSRSCAHKFWWLGVVRKKSQPKTCLECKQVFIKPQGRAEYHWTKQKYCSRQCVYKASTKRPNHSLVIWNKANPPQKGKKHFNWKGGKPKCFVCQKQLTTYNTKNCRQHAHLFRPKDYYKKILRRRKMSELEIKVQSVITKYKLPYKFVGNGEFFIERKNPDFININGEKKAIEVYCRAHKENLRGLNILQWRRARSDLFAKYGWSIIFIEDWQTNSEQTIISLINNH